MKKMICILVTLLMIPVMAAAEINLDGMTYEELVELKDKINLAIWKSEEWQEVEVPKGVYSIGEDIPTGKWTIKAPEKDYVKLYWGDALDESGVNMSYDGRIWELERLTHPEYRYYEKGDATEVTWDLKEGQYIIVDEGTAVFTPYAGKPSLGFK